MRARGEHVTGARGRERDLAQIGSVCDPGSGRGVSGDTHQRLRRASEGLGYSSARFAGPKVMPQEGGDVAAMQGEVALALDAGPDYDAERRVRLSQRLRVELLDVDVDVALAGADLDRADSARLA